MLAIALSRQLVTVAGEHRDRRAISVQDISFPGVPRRIASASRRFRRWRAVTEEPFAGHRLLMLLTLLAP